MSEEVSGDAQAEIANLVALRRVTKMRKEVLENVPQLRVGPIVQSFINDRSVDVTVTKIPEIPFYNVTALFIIS